MGASFRRIASVPLVALAACSLGLSAFQRSPVVRFADLPVGLGIAQVAPVAGGALHFFRPPGLGEAPGDYPSSDTVTFGTGQPSVDILTAPPWLVPEHLKMDYELLQFRVLTLTRDWMEVIGNTRTGEAAWIDRASARFSAWPEFLLGVHSVEALDSDANPVRARPLDGAPILSSARAALPPLAVQGDWLKVATHALADRMPPDGWIRWRRADRLLIRYNPFS